MKTIQFRVELISDIILNQKAASKGNQQSLDFIPGSNFLGIVASNYDSYSSEEQLDVFHNSKVRFGDAHPLYNNARALRTPANFHFPKLDTQKEECYIHNKIEEYKNVASKQLKQSRSGFYTFEDNNAFEVTVDMNFSIKSAYDRKKRRSEDEKMYGYESMQQGMTYCFDIVFDDEISDSIIEKVKNHIVGLKRVGRSRTAQYGLVDITEGTFNRVTSNFDSTSEIVVYAESRLIFFDDDTAMPTFVPKPENFGVTGGNINWMKSQVRTFAYSPYNYYRQCFDAERKGIEKGSIIVIERVEDFRNCEYVGRFQNEGFGKVIFNPPIFSCDNDAKSDIKFHRTNSEIDLNKNNSSAIQTNEDKILNKYLLNQRDNVKIKQRVYELVNDYVKKNAQSFKQDIFASQWGSIRSIALRYPKSSDLEKELFDYLTHGVAEEKWGERNRRKGLRSFFNEIKKELSELNEEMIQSAIINLASEMAKKSRRR